MRGRQVVIRGGREAVAKCDGRGGEGEEREAIVGPERGQSVFERTLGLRQLFSIHAC